ncbi:hypothetical protein ACPRNU_01820 [Chromobacterium vaccinii]|uniref:hypothetical protein n=1 Tax=Chromobacterium vaccinii TaxID=1108595 RepID=UPI003C757102
MQDVMQPIGTADKQFRDGNPAKGELGTIVTAAWLNAVQGSVQSLQAEMATLLAAQNMQPDATKNNQVLEVITRLAWGGSQRPTTLAGYGITDAAWRDPERRVWGAAFRANKGDPAAVGDDGAAVGYGFDVDGDTGLFAATSSSPGAGSAKLMLKIDNLECLTVSSDGALRSAKYGWLHERFAAQANTLAGYGIADGATKSDLSAAVTTMRTLFAGQVAPRGHRKWPDGQVEQWFSVQFGRRDEVVPYVFPLAMAEVYGVWPSVLDAEGEVTALLASAPTSTGGTIRTRGIYGGPPDEGTIYIRAIGRL